MFEMIYSGYAFLASFVPFAAVLYLRKRKTGRAAKDAPKHYWLLLGAFVVYVLCVFSVTGAGTLAEALDWKFRYLTDRINLIPFSREIDPVGYGLNVVMLVPFGFLVPLIWQDRASLGKTALSGAAFSLLIELSQMLGYRGTDVDDLIMNTLGAVLGYACYSLWDRRTGSRWQLRTDPWELPGAVLSLYLGRCLLFDALGFIQMWYGY